MKKIADLILDSKYEEAYLQMYNMSFEEKWELVGDGMYDKNPLIVYTFLLYLIAKDLHEPEWHYNCFLYLVFYNPFFDDTMGLAAWHIRKALEFYPDNMEYKKQIISIFYSYSEHHFTDEEFKKYAADVLENEPNNENAKEILHKSNS